MQSVSSQTGQTDRLQYTIYYRSFHDSSHTGQTDKQTDNRLFINVFFIILVVNFTRFLVTRDRQTDRQLQTIYLRFSYYSSHYLLLPLVIQDRRTDKQLFTIVNKRTSTASHRLFHSVALSSLLQCKSTQIGISLSSDFLQRATPLKLSSV